MTDDGDWLRLLQAAQMVRAKVVAVGDHRQLGAVGQGGASNVAGPSPGPSTS